MSRAAYTARSTRSGDRWGVDIEELDGVFTHARRLDQVEAMARDAIALTLDVDASSFDVVIRPVLPPQRRGGAAPHAAQPRNGGDDAKFAALEASGRADVAPVSGAPPQRYRPRPRCSHQRAHQLLDEDLSDVFDQIAPIEGELDTSKRTPIGKLRAKLGLG
jgi:predicted RNase H-like HicB family nuclease